MLFSDYKELPVWNDSSVQVRVFVIWSSNNFLGASKCILFRKRYARSTDLRKFSTHLPATYKTPVRDDWVPQSFSGPLCEETTKRHFTHDFNPNNFLPIYWIHVSIPRWYFSFSDIRWSLKLCDKIIPCPKVRLKRISALFFQIQNHKIYNQNHKIYKVFVFPTLKSAFCLQPRVG